MSEPLVSANLSLSEMVAAVRAAGYAVMAVPHCRHSDRPHAPHPLAIRSVGQCPGVEPFPHGWLYTAGLWGQIERCACGQSFYNDRPDDDPESWNRHKREVGLS